MFISNALNGIHASKRLRNSGVKVRSIAPFALPLVAELLRKPSPPLESSLAPAFVVIIKITLRKSAFLPLLSVNVALSITCKSKLNKFGCAFSISSKTKTACGVFIIASVKSPPWSKPTYPGGAPINRETVCDSAYSLISKRINSTPSSVASCFESSVLPTPVGPENKNDPIGRFGCDKPAREIWIAATTFSIASSCP